MLLTKECDYAVRIVRALSDYEKRQVKSLCDMEHIPLQFAYKILKKLERGGIVASYRGTNGGYKLTKELNQITLYDIFTSMDDNALYISECLRPERTCPNNVGGDPCKVHIGLKEFQDSLINAFKGKTMDLFC